MQKKKTQKKPIYESPNLIGPRNTCSIRILAHTPVKMQLLFFLFIYRKKKHHKQGKEEHATQISDQQMQQKPLQVQINNHETNANISQAMAKENSLNLQIMVHSLLSTQHLQRTKSLCTFKEMCKKKKKRKSFVFCLAIFFLFARVLFS
ncbi:unnamed protein product [Ixodes persulcatus]